MSGGLGPANTVLTAAFKAALLSQGVLALFLFATLAIGWVACREMLPARASARLPAQRMARQREPAGRATVRIGFGVLWIFDAILQAQPAMPAGLPSRVIAPAADGSPGWVQHLVNWAGTGWSYHPVQDAAGAVWIQLGIGVWLLAAARGPWSRAAGLASAGWGLVVWAFGEAFGGLLGPGLSLLTGAPGAALLYTAGGLLVALPARHWASSGPAQLWLRFLGAGLAAAAVLQAWPGHGYWQGILHGRPAGLAAMAQSMAGIRQPAALDRLVSGFGTLAAAHGFAVNLVVVIVLAAGAAALLTGHSAIIRPAVIGLTVFFLADWVLVQDLGFFGGLGTDPNSMVPLVLLVGGAFVAATRVPARLQAAGQPATAEPAPPSGPGRRLRVMLGTASASVVVALWAGAVMTLGAAPMAMAAVHRTADPIIATALNGAPKIMDTRAAPFDLTDTGGNQVSLASLRGKVVLLTFLDPVSARDGPLLAQEFRQADQVLGRRADHVALVAIVANPLYRSLDYTRAFDRQELLTRVPNWYFLTGSQQQLIRAWAGYAAIARLNGPGAMVLHPDIAYVIDARGQARAKLNLDPGPGTASSQSSFAVELAQAAERVMGPG